MFGFKLVKKLLRRTHPSLACVLQSLPDSLLNVRVCGKVKQSLIGASVLHNGCRLPLYGEHHGTLALLKLLYEVAGTAPESRE